MGKYSATKIILTIDEKLDKNIIMSKLAAIVRHIETMPKSTNYKLNQYGNFLVWYKFNAKSISITINGY